MLVLIAVYFQFQDTHYQVNYELYLMLVQKLEKIIDGTKYAKHKNMKELLILSILSKIFIQNAFSVIVLCSVIVELNTESWRVTKRF